MALAQKTDHKRMVMGGDCYNYALLATGFVDVVCESGLKLHDFAALVPVVEGAGGTMCDWNGEPLHAGSDGHVLAIGDPARLEDVLEALGGLILASTYSCAYTPDRTRSGFRRVRGSAARAGRKPGRLGH